MGMISALGTGLLFGLLLSVMIGPVFFSLIQNSIEKGFWAGFQMAIGISLSDAIYIFITYLGISQLSDRAWFQVSLGVVGGVILLSVAAYSYFKPLKRPKKMNMENSKKPFKQIAKGMMLNGINPFVLLFWISISSVVTINKEYNTHEAVWFFIGIISVVFGTDVLKSYLANKLSDMLTIRLMRRLNQLVALALTVFAIRLFYHAIHICLEQ